MADEKKKGFWSWLGFGKKEEAEQPQDTVETAQEQAVSSEQEIAKNEAEQTACESAHQPEGVLEQVEERVETFVEQTEEKVESVVDQLEEKAEEIVEKLEETFETAKEKVEDFVENVEEKIEEKLEQLEEKIEPVVEHVAEKAEQVEEKVEAFAEETVEVVEEISEKVVDPAETLKQEIVGEIQQETEEAEVPQDEYQEKPASEGGFFSRLIKGLIKTKQNIGSGFRNFFSGKKIDDELFEELEEQLLVADLGMPTTTKIINNLTQHATKQQLRDAELLYQQLKVELAEVLKPVAQPLVISDKKPYVILMVGVNGVGKTTTIGKLARKFQSEGKSVMLAAGDTFRAAAVEQLQVWGERNQIPVVAQSTGSDSASVIFDAMQSAAAKGIDVLIADTAGRLQNKNNLMDELKKIVRVMKKYDETAPHEIMLTLDAGTGQNAISQAKLFNEAVGLTGIALTKLDGTAKGGVIFAIADQFNIPIRFIGVGEKIEDLRPFDADEFIEALFSHEEDK